MTGMTAVMVRWLTLVLAVIPSVAGADAKAGEKKAQLCLLCHKPNNQVAYVPTLEGQPREYLYLQIKAYKERRRPDPVMQTNVASLSDRDMRDIAEYFASRSPVRQSFAVDAARVARGKTKAEDLRCAACHLADFSGKKEVPRLAGLHPKYGEAQIRDFAATKRPHPRVDGMTGLAAEDAEALAEYFAQLE